jgi:glycosyltransferase involved in cell wall biosynthesis
MDAFALTSDSEGMPLAVLEAWAARRPVAASRVGGVPEVVTDGRDGLLFAPGDEAALAAALSLLLADRDRARGLGEAGRRKVEASYSLRRMAETYQDHYRELARARRPVAAGGCP